MHPFIDYQNMGFEDLFVRRALFENPTLEVFKTEIREELTAQRKKQEVLEAQMGSIVENQ